jgi:FimV-like protein
MLKIARPLRLSALSVALMAGSALTGTHSSFAAVPAASASQRTTQDGDNLWNMSLQVGRDQAKPVQQWMVAVLRGNPDAFLLGNIHRLRSGVLLVLPSEADVQVENLADAAALVARHLESLQSNVPMPVLAARTPAPALAAAPSLPASAPAGAAAGTPEGAPAVASAAAPSSIAAAPAAAFVPPAPAARDAEVGAQPPGTQPMSPLRRWLPYALAVILVGALAAAGWWVRRRGTRAIPHAVSTLFQDTIQLFQGKPRLPAVSTAAADIARSVERLGSSTNLVRVESGSEPGISGATAASTSEIAIKFELARAQVEVGRKEAAKRTLQSILHEGNKGQQELARQQLQALGAA